MRLRDGSFSILLALALSAAALHACKGDATTSVPENDVGVETPADTNIGVVASCVTSPTLPPLPATTCPAAKPDTPDSLDEALGLAGIDRCKLVLDPKQVRYSGWNLADKRRLPDYQTLLQNPLLLPGYGRETAKMLDEAVASENPISRGLAAMALRRGKGVDKCPDPLWFVLDSKDENPLATAIIDASSAAGAPVDAEATTAAAATVPLELQRALAPIVRALAATSAEVVAARGTPDAKNLNLLSQWPSWMIGSRQIPMTPEFLAALDGVDVDRMIAAATTLATTIEAAKLSRFAGLALAPFEVATPFGAIVVHGSGKDEYKPGSLAEGAALVLDTGGDDTYRVPVGAGTVDRPVSIAIDLGGKDTYGYVEKKIAADAFGSRLPSDSYGRAPRTNSRVSRQGAGVLGVGLLYDLGKDDDVYRSLAVSQGVGVLGVGALFDEGGNDDYAAEVLSQGAAGFGVGLLLDRAGNDHYLGYADVQGHAGTGGVGALVDLAGDDRYFTDSGDPALKGDNLYDSPQLPGRANSAMSQGCGYGRRWDTLPAPYNKSDYQFIGGMGILRDASGSDTYLSSVFAQGCGFLGLGMLLEEKGDDAYDGFWYVQGATAHMGIALFYDRAGNDKYDQSYAAVATSIGAGHDFSSTVHVDEGGDDLYGAPGLSLGAGNANGIGILVNAGGIDVFSAGNDFTMGGAVAGGEFVGGARYTMPTYGVFVKAGGSAKYFIAGVEKPERVGGQWSYAPESSGDAGVDAARSTGVDRPAGKVVLP